MVMQFRFRKALLVFHAFESLMHQSCIHPASQGDWKLLNMTVSEASEPNLVPSPQPHLCFDPLLAKCRPE